MPTSEFTIRELSKEFGVTTRTLRFYEEKGLLTPTRCGQNRIYDSADRTRLILILRGKALGFTLEESAELIAMYDPASDNEHQLMALIEKIREKKTRMEAQQHEIEKLIKDLADWEKRSMKSLNALQKKTSEKNP